MASTFKTERQKRKKTTEAEICQAGKSSLTCSCMHTASQSPRPGVGMRGMSGTVGAAGISWLRQKRINSRKPSSSGVPPSSPSGGSSMSARTRVHNTALHARASAHSTRSGVSQRAPVMIRPVNISISHRWRQRRCC